MPPGVIFKCATLPSAPHLIVEPINGTKLVGNNYMNLQSVSGSIGEVWREIQLNLNFKYWTVLSSDGKWSTHLPNGTWLGLFGMLQRNEIDIALGLGTIHKISSERGTHNS